MTQTAFDVIARLAGKTLATAESLTAGGIGAALTAVPGASGVYKGGVISYCDDVKHQLLGVPRAYLSTFGAVSAPVAEAMAVGVKELLRTDIAVSVTGLAGPGADEFGHSVGTVFIGYADKNGVSVGEYHFTGDRDAVRTQTVETALRLILENA
jgi:nicotinamide-nucleotide amidase